MLLRNTSKAATASPFRNFNSIYSITFRGYIVDAPGRIFYCSLWLTFDVAYENILFFLFKNVPLDTAIVSEPIRWENIHTNWKEKIVRAWEQFYTNLREISLLGMHRWRLVRVQWFYHDFAFRTTIIQIKFEIISCEKVYCEKSNFLRECHYIFYPISSIDIWLHFITMLPAVEVRWASSESRVQSKIKCKFNFHLSWKQTAIFSNIL